MIQPSSHNRLGLRGDPTQESSVVKALAGAGQAITPGRSIKQTLQLRERYPLGPELWDNRGRRAAANLAKAEPATSSRWDHRSTDDGMGERTGRVNWGPSVSWRESARPGGHKH